MASKSALVLLAWLVLCNMPAAATERHYHDAFYQAVSEFASRNRFNTANLPLQARNECAMVVAIRTTVAADGTVVQAEVMESSGNEKVDKYFVYVVKQAAPYAKLEAYIASNPQTLNLETRFVMDLRKYDETRRSAGPCSEYQVRRLLGEYSI